jgi:thiamine biosynthesis protein ThiI
MSSVVVHYGELALKGRNRPWFINMLVRTIGTALNGLDVLNIRSMLGRIVIELGPEVDWTEVRTRLAPLPGIGNFANATHVAPDIDLICNGVVNAVRGRPMTTFRVMARRADKRFPIPSPEIERLVGARVQTATGWAVDLSNPQLIIRVEVLTKDAFYFVDREAGVGGLPVGTGGRVLALLSGGIDSPVAAWRLIRRGCRASFVHFHSYPIVSRTSQDKARELTRILTRGQLASRLYLVPFGALQQQVVISVPPAFRVLIYRRLMLRIADRIAERAGAHALVTGDAVGQVASQTIENLAVIGAVTRMTLLRPLVGMDKEEITADARRIGTYETSVVPDEDCCSLFTPRFPATRAILESVEAAEAALDVPALVDRALADVVVEDFRFPMLRSSTPALLRIDTGEA